MPPDLSTYAAGNCGIPYVIALDSGKPGPRALITALVHGDEICGAVALDFLLRSELRPRYGRLVLVFANPAAYGAPRGPLRCVDEDLNRLWSREILDGPGDSVERARARELRPLLDGADLLLDLHSTTHDSPPLALCGPTEKAAGLALGLGMPRFVVRDAGHPDGRRMRDYAGFSDAVSAKNALLVECGRNGTPESAQVARAVMLRFLLHHGFVDPNLASPYLGSAPGDAQTVIEVTETVACASERFRFAAPYKCMDVVPCAGTPIAHDGELTIRAPYDNCVLVMPTPFPVAGRTAVRLGRVVTAGPPRP
jgi:predicted deacylase